MSEKNRLTIIGKTHRFVGNKNRPHYVCQCICGNIAEVAVDKYDKATFSCGCLYEERKLDYGEANFNRLYDKYKKRALKNGLEFTLEKEYFRDLTKQQCFYCCAPPRQVVKRNDANGNYVYNGIDRKDSDGGYTVENCVACCWVCNFMKRDLPEQKFYGHLNKIIENIKSKGLI